LIHKKKEIKNEDINSYIISILNEPTSMKYI
jgi:hypothetical protein